MRKYIPVLSVLFIVLLVNACSCKNKGGGGEPIPEYGAFPDEVGAIIVGKCAVAGCHNAASYQNSANLLLDTWQHLFDGGSSGASVVPYSPDFSPLLYFVNTDPARGTVALPTMPYDPTGANTNALTEAEYNTLKGWIANGAPDKDGNIAFSSDPDTRQKIYLTQQGCDLVAVIDAKSNLVMRYIKIGTQPGNVESPHCLKISADGRYAYVSFLSGSGLQKIDTRTDQVVKDATLGTGSWNIVFVAPNDSTLLTTDWASPGRLLFANSNTMSLLPEYALTSGLIFPHGIATDVNMDTCFVTGQYGNVVYRWAPKVPHFKRISINGNPPVATSSSDNSSPNPHEIVMAPDYSKYFLTCEGTNEIRVMDAHSDEILKVIPVGKFPQEMAMSHSKPYLFVTCMEDEVNAPAGAKGSVYVIDYNTYEVVRVITGDFYQPHGIAVDDINNTLLIASTNSNPDGPAPHHATACGGRAGWYSMYNLNTLQPLNNRRYQVTVMPYSADVRFKTP